MNLNAITLELRLYWESLVRLLYPAQCAVCQTPLVINESLICGTCEKQIKPVPETHCLRCVRPLPPFSDHHSVCSHCRSDRPYFDRGFSLILFEEHSKELFHEIKFKKKPWLLEILQPFYALAPRVPNLNDYDMIVPIPMDGWRKRDREFNQAKLIAKHLIRWSGSQNSSICSLLKKTRRTTPQSLLPRNERLNNLENAFKLRNPKSVFGKRILLVDDILTTGSTINEGAKLFKQHGAERVDFFTFARAQNL